MIALLWSINERLGGNPGFDFEEPNRDWIDDLTLLDKRDRDKELRDKKTSKGIEADPELFEG